MFVDTAKVSLKAGKGGDGAVSFRHEIYIPKGGPDGGNGGKGGDIIFRADKDTNTLIDFRFTPILTAENGKNGAGQRAAGRSGKDLIVEVPIGTVVYRLEHEECSRSRSINGDGPFTERPSPVTTGARKRSENDEHSRAPVDPPRVLIADLTEDGQEVVIAKGGDGGFGNAHFKSSVRQTPRIAEVGEPGEEFEALLELKSMADVGLVGLPNAGKSTFLSVVSNAKPEIADYPFTTITPNLGVATIDGRDLLIADIPGLIEGASEGKGLGHDFLRHVDRTAVLLHLIDVYNNDAGEAYQTIRRELDKYSDLKTRPEIIALTKCEGVDDDIIKMQMASILAKNPSAEVYAISSAAHQGLTNLLRALVSRVFVRNEEISRSRSVGTDEERPEDVILQQCAGADSDGRPGAGKTSFSRDNSRLGRSETYIPDATEEAARRADFPGLPAYDVSDGLAGPEKRRFTKPLSSCQEKDVRPGPAADRNTIPTISLSPNALKDTWHVEKLDNNRFRVTGEKIEKFARRTDLNNYASVNRLRDIMKKLGIRSELTTQGAQPDSIIEIAGKEFTLVEDY